MSNVGFHQDAVTVSLWYYSESQPHPYPHFFDYGNYKLRCHIMSGSIYNSTDRYGILSEAYNPDGYMIRGSVKPGDSVWTHVVVTFNKSTRLEKLYINGVLDKQMTVGTAQLSLADDQFCVGRVKTDAGQVEMTYFKGKIDDIFIYNRELSTQDINDLYSDSTQAGGSTGVSEIKNNVLKVSIYPNPSSESFSFKCTGQNSENLTYSIIDITGKLLSEGTINEDVSIKTFNTGIYFVQIYDENRNLITTEKLVKQ